MLIGHADSFTSVSVVGTIRLWHARDIFAEAGRLGLISLLAPQHSLSSLHQSLHQSGSAQIGAGMMRYPSREILHSTPSPPHPLPAHYTSQQLPTMGSSGVVQPYPNSSRPVTASGQMMGHASAGAVMLLGSRDSPSNPAIARQTSGARESKYMQITRVESEVVTLPPMVSHSLGHSFRLLFSAPFLIMSTMLPDTCTSPQTQGSGQYNPFIINQQHQAGSPAYSSPANTALYPYQQQMHDAPRQSIDMGGPSSPHQSSNTPMTAGRSVPYPGFTEQRSYTHTPSPQHGLHSQQIPMLSYAQSQHSQPILSQALPVLQMAPDQFMGTCQTLDASELTLIKLVGTGAYGKVWLAEWTGCEVAVKELIGFGNDESESHRAWVEMQNEVHLLGSLSHPNVMRFMAISINPPMIVMQYYSHGTLFALLQKAKEGDHRALRELNWSKRLAMIKDVAAGMHYLHSRKPSPVIHGDLRSPNLLLDMTVEGEKKRYHVKIAGVSDRPLSCQFETSLRLFSSPLISHLHSSPFYLLRFRPCQDDAGHKPHSAEQDH